MDMFFFQSFIRKKDKKEGFQSSASDIDGFWCVQLAHSLEYAVVVIHFPYIGGPVMLLWEQGNRNEASDV